MHVTTNWGTTNTVNAWSKYFRGAVGNDFQLQQSTPPDTFKSLGVLSDTICTSDYNYQFPIMPCAPSKVQGWCQICFVLPTIIISSSQRLTRHHKFMNGVRYDLYAWLQQSIPHNALCAKWSSGVMSDTLCMSNYINQFPTPPCAPSKSKGVDEDDLHV